MRIADFVSRKGKCPSCSSVPSRGAAATSEASAVKEGRPLTPMLAQPWANVAHVISPTEKLFVSPKLDGIRCITAFNPKLKKLVFLSRTGLQFESCDHLVRQLLPIYFKDPALVLDGELYNHKLSDDFESLVSAVRVSRDRASPKHRSIQAQLQYHIFDVMYSKHLRKNAPFADRHKLYSSLFPPGSSRTGSIVPVTQQVLRKQDLDKALEEAINKAYEGIMIRTEDGAYGFGKRSPTLLKYKKMTDAEFTIVNSIEGEGKWAGMLGAFLCVTPQGHTFTVSPSVTEDIRKSLWRKRSNLAGKALTVQFQALTKYGIPRFPIGKCIRGAASGSDWV